MIHVYAVTDRSTVAAHLLGVEAAPVELLPVGCLAVAVSRHEGATTPSTDAVLAHAQVCDELLHDGSTVLPVRFGARYADEEGVRQAVHEQHGQLAAALERVRGHVEVGVRVAWTEAEDDLPAGAQPAAATGTDYLRRRLDEERTRAARRADAQAIADEINGALVPLAVAAELKVLATPGLVLSAAYLVREDAVRRFTEAAATTVQGRSELQLVCTGPWPPYHFAGAEGLS